MTLLANELCSDLLLIFGVTTCPLHRAPAPIVSVQVDASGREGVWCPMCQLSYNPVHFLAVARGEHVLNTVAAINTRIGFGVSTSPTLPALPCKFYITPTAPVGDILDGDAELSYWLERGLTKASIRAFGAGTFAGLPALPVLSPGGLRTGIIQRNPDFPVDQTNTPKVYPEKYIELGAVREHLFGLPQARSLNLPFLVLVEGPIDAMRCWEAGLPAVALLGNTINTDQITRLGEITDRVVLLVDNDPLGDIFSTTTNFRRWVQPFFHLRVGTLPPGQDPGSLSTRELLDIVEPLMVGW